MDSKFILVLLFGITLATFAGVPDNDEPKEEPASETASVAARQPKREMSSGGVMAIERSPDGHFYTDAQVNGVTVRFLVDSGASTVALTAEDAARIGKHVSASDMTIKVQTANGETGVAPVTLDSVALGSVTVNQVEAVVAGEGLGISLLGQSFLARVGKVNIENDRMTLD